MGDQSIQRRLAAILAADVADYSRLVNEDEAATIEAWHAARALIDPTIAAFGGRIVKHTGDGFLAEFGTATEAVECAIRMQDDLTGRSRGVPENRRMLFRMGINLGEITADADDIHGDGVNIAARLEGLADAGGIMISANVFEQVRKRIDRDFEDMGTETLKNIAEPVRHYRVRLDGSEPPSQAGPPSLAVLPFHALDGTDAQKSFGAGLTEDLITSLTSKPGIRVLAASSGGKRPNAQYYFEGSVRGSGKIRITAQLIDARTGFHLWGGRYDRMFTDPLELQAEVSAKIVATLDEKLAAIRDARQPGASEDSSGIMLAGLEFIGRVAEEAIALLGAVIGWFMD